ncbi:16S rRNA (guanine527-N7)-methyltransferase [Paracoccus isoporae]|uniref:16S rRNA (Guanine527-N7)-methyltransferase n=1 Tax=Paracoccus isoporae TaxID=591205 RepID=A0A1G6V103_9RHOB|nr:16S rRNA (guanine527-N7)-methyltransferase [Paracoccus isoporae]
MPGVVVAILAHAQPLTVTLVESDRRKAAFLTTARRELDLSNLHIRCQRIETIPDAAHDFVSARALASVKNLLPNLARQLASQGEAWLLKGRSWRGEVELARQDWSFDMEVFPSATDPESVVLKLRNIERHV